MSETEMVFNLFEDGSGNLTNIGDAMRAAGSAPTDEEIAALPSSMDMAAFTEACGSIVTPGKDELLAAFEVFDMHGNGFIALTELQHVMKNLGEGMDEAMLKNLEAASGVDKEGQVSIRHVVDVLTQGF